MLQNVFFGKVKNNYSEDIIDILRLIRSENVGNRTFIALINCFGSAKIALENIADFSLKGGRNKPIKVYPIDKVNKELELLDKNNAKIIAYNDERYSNLLREISDFPPILTYKGNISLLSEKLPIAVVGARNASINAQNFTKQIVKELVQEGHIIVSGLARGIDTAAHSVSIKKTIAVLAGGIDHIYPPENIKLYNAIAEEGLLISELPIGSLPLSVHFPQRNRIISGISIATVVMEATLKSGSLITAMYALEQNREVCAVPNFPLDPRSQGTNKLIKEGARIVERTADIIDAIKHYNTYNIKSSNNDLNQNFKIYNNNHNITDVMRQSVLGALSNTPTVIDDIIKVTNYSLDILYVILLELELAGKIIRTSGNSFALNYI